jgi:hypothetical protein
MDRYQPIGGSIADQRGGKLQPRRKHYGASSVAHSIRYMNPLTALAHKQGELTKMIEEAMKCAGVYRDESVHAVVRQCEIAPMGEKVYTISKVKTMDGDWWEYESRYKSS